MTAPAIAVRIQHHPSRAGLPRRLVAQLGAFEDVLVIPDPQPDGPLDAWRAHRACLEAMPASATHLLVLQDDALPLDGFAAKLTAAGEEHPDSVLCAFTPGFSYLRRALLAASKQGKSYAPMTVGAFVPCVATLYPRAFVIDLLDWADSHAARARRPIRGADDGVLAMFCRHARIQPLLMVPPIIDHDETLPSIGKFHRRAGPHRRAAVI